MVMESASSVLVIKSIDVHIYFKPGGGGAQLPIKLVQVFHRAVLTPYPIPNTV